jgi:hypothetical protein
MKENKSKDAGALGMIQRGVSETIFPRIMGVTRAKERLGPFSKKNFKEIKR